VALRQTSDSKEILAKVEDVLRVAAAHGHCSVVLGAWGCGAFSNDAGMVARQMLVAVRGSEFADCFDEVTFAVPDEGKVAKFNHCFTEPTGLTT
jgi:uncharacterized protein (TIGR02452 family)